MNCERVRELMSAYYDRELTPDLETEVREHLERCPVCVEQLAQFAELSKLAADMRQPEVPTGMWSSINASLSAKANERATVPWRRYSQFGIAATLLIAASIALVAYWNGHPTDEHREMAETFGEYLDRFQQQPENAQEVLLTRYQGRLVEPQQAAGEAKFNPNAPDKLPQGFSRAAMYVLGMPCCTCTQTIYKDGHGNVLALFEHTDQQRSWFGERPTITAQCHGKSTCIVQLQGELAACWQCGPRHLTIVGARDVEQVSELVAYLDAQQQALQAARGPT
ncbi:MAG: anti-sigma factor [Pirellulales bacterium]